MQAHVCWSADHKGVGSLSTFEESKTRPKRYIAVQKNRLGVHMLAVLIVISSDVDARVRAHTLRRYTSTSQ